MNIERSDDLCRWYVVHTNPKQEERANNNLRSWGVETLHAKLRTRRYNQFTGAASYITQPLFPRYIFAKFNARKQLPKIWFTRGVHSIVSFGSSPTPVNDDVIQIIQTRTAADGLVRIGDDLKAGDEVMIQEGPLRGIIGVFEKEMNEADRVRILLREVNFQGHVLVPRSDVKKLMSAARRF